jgi:hypothetical protein
MACCDVHKVDSNEAMGRFALPITPSEPMIGSFLPIGPIKTDTPMPKPYQSCHNWRGHGGAFFYKMEVTEEEKSTI